MATNYNFAEMVKILASGAEKEKVQDIGKRFPMTAYHINRLIGAASGDMVIALADAIPSYVTAGKVEKFYKNDIQPDADVDADADIDADTDAEEEVAEEKPKEQAKGKRGRPAKAKEVKEAKEEEKPKGKRGRPAKKAEPIEVEEDETEEEENPYEGKTAMELYREAKKRGLKPEAKKPAKYYIDMLVADDNKVPDADADDEDDDWDI